MAKVIRSKKMVGLVPTCPPFIGFVRAVGVDEVRFVVGGLLVPVLHGVKVILFHR